MEEIGIAELTLKQVETLCAVAEKAARDYVFSKVPSRKVASLNITVDTEGLKPVTVNVEVEIALSPLMGDYNVKQLAKEATKEAFKAVEEYLRGLACRSTR